MAFLRMSSIIEEMGYRTKTSVYDDIRDGRLTKLVKLGERSVGLPDYEVKAINDAKLAGRTNDQIRELVGRLHAKRTELAEV